MKNSRAGAFLIVSRRMPRGFALVVSLSLMVLLTVLAVGLLGLSSLSLQTSTRETDLAEARANARMSLALAIAQLQKNTGPDQRVTMTSDQLGNSSGDDSAAGFGKRHWTGVYRSWGSATNVRPTPQFLSWLNSGEANDLEDVNTPKGNGDGGNSEIELVGEGTVGDVAEGKVRVPALTVTALSGGKARVGWWTGDQGIKAAMATPPVSEELTNPAVRTSVQGAPRNAVEFASASQGKKPFAKLDLKDPKLPMVTGWKQSSFLAEDRDSPRGLFHDIAPFSTGLLTNLRTGGFRKDLSMQLERNSAQATSQLATNTSNGNKLVLYKVGGENGINMHELWAYYNLYKEVKNQGSFKYTTGGTMPSGSPFVQVDARASDCLNDDEFFFKQPLITSYQMVLSLTSVNNELCVVMDPIITFWNPLDVPVVVPTSAFFSIKYWAIPYDLVINAGGTTHICPLIRAFSGGDSNFLSLTAGSSVQQLVFKPGEVIKVSQYQGLVAGAVDHNLVAKAGFNIGNGLRYPLKTEAGTKVTVATGTTITYQARPNTYTAGAANGTGMVPAGYATHSRHFSTTHHEVYVGWDRKDSRAEGSMGYGGMYIDYDFGNKRLKPSDAARQEGTPGTKPSGARMNAKQHPEVFREITSAMTRPLSASQLAGSKSPIMILSYNAKTEGSTDANARTRYLSRLNPRAHHVDFYDLSQKERDMLPYEYVVDPLISWKNRSLETSTTGNAYFGGGLNAELGSSFVTTHSVPKEPIVSLGALQHSFANGFEIFKPKDGYAALNAREPMLPQISHAIGNSVAPAVLSPGQTEGMLNGNRPLADHSYLANVNLWDDWFFSGIAPQTGNSYAISKRKNQRQIASEFLDGTTKLATVRYQPDLGGQDLNSVLAKLFSGSTPTEAATQLAASLIRVDGMFNVNSTSVQAWKAVLGGLNGREIITRSNDGKESITTPKQGEVPVIGLMGPTEGVADGKTSQIKDPDQWTGRRTLSEDDIEELARAIVKEVRKRGPFLSVADFVNRRVGSDKDLAKSGAIQSALDSKDVKINSAWQGDRAIANNVSKRFAFPEAEEGTAGYGMPGIVKQADILTPIAPILSARSDSFIIRAYGESVDK
ncbi:MAG TPA: hypothetical protein VGE67_19630, partial [Haloferula sp.]